MKKYRYIRILYAMLLISCLLLSVSCRGSGETEQTTAATTEATTSLTEATTTAVTEPPLPEVPLKSEISEVFNRQVLRLFSDEASGEGTEAEKMMDVMLPYLLGNGESAPAADSYHISNVTVTGDALSMPSA